MDALQRTSDHMTSYLGPLSDVPPLRYSLIMADPPWRFRNYSKKGEHKNASAKYRCMPLDDIKAMNVADLAQRDCLLWLWATNPMLPQAIEVMAAWGFTYVTAGSWIKTTRHGKVAFGTGYVLRSANEPFLIGRLGKPKTSRSIRSAFHGLARAHSQKPEEGYALAERMMPGALRIELFSRLDRPGWDAWGDEAGKFNGGSTHE